jgi:hypothetical protein
MELITIVIIFFLIYIILLSSFYGSTKKKIYEGLAGATVTSASMQLPITKSDLITVLNEQIDNINKHELALSRLDTSYVISQPPSRKDLMNIDTIHITNNNSENTYTVVLPDYIKRIMDILENEDKTISTMLSTYVPNSDIPKLRDGSLLENRAKELYNKSHYPESMEDCDPKTIQQLINGYKKLISDNPSVDSTTMTMWTSTIANLQMKQAALNAVDSSVPNNTKCNPALSVTEAESILDGIYANHITKIIHSQDEAIQNIIKTRDTSIINFYQSLV